MFGKNQQKKKHISKNNKKNSVWKQKHVENAQYVLCDI